LLLITYQDLWHFSIVWMDIAAALNWSLSVLPFLLDPVFSFELLLYFSFVLFELLLLESTNDFVAAITADIWSIDGILSLSI